MNQIKDFDIVPIASQHFSTVSSKSNSKLDYTTQTNTNVQTWQSILALASSSNDSTQTLSSTPSKAFLSAFNQRVSQENWGYWTASTELSVSEALEAGLKENVKWKHPETSSLSLVVGNEEVHVSLKMNDKLVSADYRSERQVWTNGVRRPSREPKPTTRADIDMCYYHGSITSTSATVDRKVVTHSVVSNGRQHTMSLPSHSPAASHTHADQPASNLSAAFDTCSGGFSGVLSVQGKLYSVMPALNHLPALEVAHMLASLESKHTHVSANSLHVVFSVEDLEVVHGGCGVDHSHAHTHTHSREHSHDEDPDHQSEVSHIDGDGVVHQRSHHHHHESQANPMHLTSLLNELKNANSPFSSSFETKAIGDQLYVEWLLTNDYLRTTAYNGEPEQNALQLANIVAGYYNFHNSGTRKFNKPVTIVLVAQVSFTTADPWTISKGTCSECSAEEVSVDELLSKWHTWRSSASAPAHDNGHLLSGHDFQGSVLGYAGTGVQCDPQNAGGIDQTTKSYQNAFNAIVIAHELGHNFDMSHDSQGNACATATNIMSASLSPSSYTGEFIHFSTCSVSKYNTYVQAANLMCLYNEPTTHWGDAVCGDGYIQGNEECDCGLNCDKDPCCDGATCKLKSTVTINGAVVAPQCSALQKCCTATCQLQPASFVCRSRLNSCDLAETCSGTSATCPVDIKKGSGRTCVDDRGIDGNCYNSECVSFDTMCFKNAGRGTTPTSGCPRQKEYNDGEFCGTRWCVQPQFSDQCFGTGAEVSDVMDTGVGCSPTGQCYNSKCVDMNTLNPDFSWKVDDWSACYQCGTLQTRSATCVDKNGVEAADNDACSPSLPVLTQRCSNITLGCVYAFSSAEVASDHIYFFTLDVPVAIFVAVTIGATFFYLLIVALCYRGVTSPVNGIKNMQDRESEVDEVKVSLDIGKVNDAHRKSMMAQQG